ncbi:MAG TPA: three-Cys-motif partner protein TcmP [Solirubrobacteraceae bacterium]|jgi:three-Cys-motif partner protein|nr:three-Cys-motif partner protein TcmP [Solirubrobacteraceae bacterium]
MTPAPGRSWGYWTQAKLQMLADYLAGFATASKGQSERVYLDAFAGEGFGLDRLTGEEFPGSARIALEAGEGAGFTRFRYFELGNRARELEQRLRADYPGRDIRVYEGDCNTTIPEALAELRPLNWAPTFAFLDPDGMELAWDTLVALADHKRGYRSAASSKPEYKVELWMLFPTAGIVRTLALDEAKVTDEDKARATRLFGSEQWQPIYDLRAAGKISAAGAREEYVNLMRWRLERDLGYRFAHPFELKNTKGGTLYHMIFATDNDAGTRIMEAIYADTAKRIPGMLQEAKDRASGQQALDLGIELAAPEANYQYEPPWEPRS